jgi:hypothetical protein
LFGTGLWMDGLFIETLDAQREFWMCIEASMNL